MKDPNHPSGIDIILNRLRNSSNATGDRHAFLKCELIFCKLAATDGTARNFSIHIELGGTYSLTPYYDVLCWDSNRPAD